jgi:sec-independent protein translocase protein TatA
MGDALAPWHIILLVVVLLLLFGSRRLPGAAKSLGESMNIFKKSMRDMSDDGDAQATTTTTAQFHQSALPLNPPQPQPQTREEQLADLQRQVSELQRQNAGGDGGSSNGTGAPLTEAQRGQQPF